MAVILRIAQWLDYLKEQDCYDNTRIIIVSDHGYYVEGFPEFESDDTSILFNNALLMVKDFNSNGPLTTSYEFMTNADTPTLATENIIPTPTNPFTGNELSDAQKYSPYQTVLGMTADFNVHDNIFDLKNWEKIDNIDTDDRSTW